MEADGYGDVGFGNQIGLSGSNNNNGGLMMMPPPPPPLSTMNTGQENSYSPLNPNRSRSFFFSLSNNQNNINPNQTRDNYSMPTDVGGSGSSANNAALKSKIMYHPHYHRLVAAYANCQKIGAPPGVVQQLEHACVAGAGFSKSGSSCLGDDPALDQFMEAYCEMLTKYEQELSKPFKEAMVFLSRIESQFKALTLSSSSDSAAHGQGSDRNASSDEDVDIINNFIDPQAEDKELKGQLLRKYSGYLGGLKQEFMKKRKKGKLPKEACQQLLDWWTRHYKWPYPSDSQKIALAESTGLDQKQINNWFINQRKRHWKPSEDMQFVVMDGTHPHYYLDSVMANPYPMDISPGYL